MKKWMSTFEMQQPTLCIIGTYSGYQYCKATVREGKWHEVDVKLTFNNTKLQGMPPWRVKWALHRKKNIASSSPQRSSSTVERNTRKVSSACPSCQLIPPATICLNTVNSNPLGCRKWINRSFRFTNMVTVIIRRREMALILHTWHVPHKISHEHREAR